MFSDQNCAISVCSGVRSVLSARPSAATWTKSLAYVALDNGGGPCGRNLSGESNVSGRLSRDEVAEIYHLRILLECDCLNVAMTRMSEADLDRIDRIRQRAEIDAATPEWNDGDWSFHEALYRPSGHGRQIEMIKGLRTTSDLYAAAHEALPKERKRWLADHRAIIAACRAGRTADAVAALTAHLTAARDFVLSRMAGNS